jgi:hypothetical protein
MQFGTNYMHNGPVLKIRMTLRRFGAFLGASLGDRLLCWPHEPNEQDDAIKLASRLERGRARGRAMAPGASQQHRSYLLRLWRAGNGNAPQWRMSLEDTRTHERQGFNDLASLVAFLEQEIGASAEPHGGADSNEAQDPA